MNRRDVLLGLAFAATAPGTAAGEGDDPHSSSSLYIPKPHLVEDRKLLHDFMEDYAFVNLVTAAPTVRITHIPVLLDRTAGPSGTVYGHIARKNPQSETFDGQHQAVIVYQGPNSYISPSWYANAPAVPTWNFAVVHASGTLKPITDKSALHDLLAKLIKTNEGRYTPSSTYDFSKIPDSYIGGMIGGIIGFEMQIDLLEGKFKLGQERSEGDKAGILKNLQTAKHDPSLFDLTSSFYNRLTKKA
jgi:transcriptional regulator